MFAMPAAKVCAEVSSPSACLVGADLAAPGWRPRNVPLLLHGHAQSWQGGQWVGFGIETGVSGGDGWRDGWRMYIFNGISSTAG